MKFVLLRYNIGQISLGYTTLRDVKARIQPVSIVSVPREQRGSECEALTAAESAPPVSFRSSLRRHPLTSDNLRITSWSITFGAQIVSMAASDELTGILSRRQEINDKLEEGLEIKPQYKYVNVFTEFHDFTRKEIKQYEATFNK